MNPYFWTPTQDAALLEYAKAKSFGEIVREGLLPGKSRSSLIARFHRLTADRVAEHRGKRHKRRVSVNVICAPKRSRALPLVADAPPGRKTFWQLGACDCRYPFPAPRGEVISYLFCGEPAAAGASYCAAHCAVVYKV